MEKLHHPNICKFHKFFFGKGSKQAILVMELAEGEVLSEFVRESKLLELHDVRKIIRCILKALAYMHARHITHRDLKPGWCDILRQMKRDRLFFGMADDLFKTHACAWLNIQIIFF